MADDQPSFASIDFAARECPAHGLSKHMRGRDGGWKCGQCIEDAGKYRIREAMPAAATAAAGQPAATSNPTLDQFPHEVSSIAHAWIASAASSYGSLVILGPVGTGKTHLACAIGSALVTAGVPALYVEARHVLRDFRKAWDAVDGRESEVWNRYNVPRVLILDDVGAGRASDADKDRISELVCDRYADGKPTIVVSNLDQKGFKAEVGDRAYSRLQHGGKLIRLLGEDRRKAKA